MSDGAGKYERLTEAGIENVVRSFFDEYEKENAEFRSQSGLAVEVIREEVGDCCDWCADIVGNYDYWDAPKEVWQRHEHCRCMVITRTSKGTYQDAWSRKEYQSEREARIAREEEIEKESISGEERKIIIEAAQSSGDSKKPKNMDGDYTDFRLLEISEDTKQKLRELNELSKETGFEYGRALCDGEWTDIQTDNMPGNVKIKYPTNSKKVEIYHSHTDDSTESSADLIALINQNVSKIGVASINGDGWIIDVADGIRPNKDELDEAVNMCYKQAQEDLKLDPRFQDWSYEERYYMLIREQMRRIANIFEWSVMGGEI